MATAKKAKKMVCNFCGFLFLSCMCFVTKIAEDLSPVVRNHIGRQNAWNDENDVTGNAAGNHATTEEEICRTVSLLPEDGILSTRCSVGEIQIRL